MRSLHLQTMTTNLKVYKLNLTYTATMTTMMRRNSNVLGMPRHTGWGREQHTHRIRQQHNSHRQQIQIGFWSHAYQTRRNLQISLIDKTTGRNMKYHLIRRTGERARVCRIMWLATLGYCHSPHFANKIFQACPPSSAVVPPSQKGKSTPEAVVIDHEAIRTHILS